ncbi:hypothetical protein F441_23108 [Phytophthora nicotianae CJ01A1]|uniref:Uncharacterized protein n=5 Tax=Phytophthora nicotianae TaxID=4792 RepID=W2R9Y2_PHYN3|nr:hypothetical protein PPTG_01669 [Phytophthora nicotianae INRA-310]ETK85102.1 hypothetical protein L915_09993 [Phytophthora nicotianae]ETO73773.1 hypothetical protein F444_10312 [Phytophthora nicotianae P1976]ETO99475.1 hypothetical protein F441_23108 [Phytophthora nicotianae CJ01A1]ETP43016.1 hypothetical protein F442_10120 [Phytophthora nicotianae P10297]ETL44451.1 hypothetical protein L916_05254 [Phytophthora nicotianae]
MDIRRLLHNPEDGGWYIIGETKSEAEMNEFPMDIEEFVCNPSELDTEMETISTDALLDG